MKRFEEKDLIRFHCEYAKYRSRVPMLIPRFFRGGIATGKVESSEPDSNH